MIVQSPIKFIFPFELHTFVQGVGGNTVADGDGRSALRPKNVP